MTLDLGSGGAPVRRKRFHHHRALRIAHVQDCHFERTGGKGQGCTEIFGSRESHIHFQLKMTPGTVEQTKMFETRSGADPHLRSRREALIQKERRDAARTVA